MTYCAVDGCFTRRGSGLIMFSLPKEEPRRQNWINSLGFVGDHRLANLTPDEATRIKVCSKHFSEDSFIKSMPRQRLCRTAIPTLLLEELPSESPGDPKQKNQDPLECSSSSNFSMPSSPNDTLIRIMGDSFREENVIEYTPNSEEIKLLEILDSAVPETKIEVVDHNMPEETLVDSKCHVRIKSEAATPPHTESPLDGVLLGITSRSKTPNYKIDPGDFINFSAEKFDIKPKLITESKECASNSNFGALSSPNHTFVPITAANIKQEAAFEYNPDCEEMELLGIFDSASVTETKVEVIDHHMPEESLDGSKCNVPIKSEISTPSDTLEDQIPQHILDDIEMDIEEALEEHISQETLNAIKAYTRRYEEMESMDASVSSSMEEEVLHVTTNSTSDGNKAIGSESSSKLLFLLLSEGISKVPTTSTSSDYTAVTSEPETFDERILKDPVWQPMVLLTDLLNGSVKTRKRPLPEEANLPPNPARKRIRKRKDPEAIYTLENVLKFLDKNCPKHVGTFISNLLLILDKSRYLDSKRFKRLALTLYLLAPKQYKKLAANMIRMPSPLLFKRVMSQWKFSTGINEAIFDVLRLSVLQTPEKSQDCVLCLQEIRVRPNLFYNITTDCIIGFEDVFGSRTHRVATRALMIMVKGISSDWEQPIAYSLSCGATNAIQLQEIIVECVLKLRSIGLNVLAVTSDLSLNFYLLVKRQLKLTAENPYFLVGDVPVYYVFSVPHLLRLTRDYFYSHLLYLNDILINKYYLEEMYNIEKERPYRLAAKLTDDHLFPNRSSKLKLDLASDVFHKSVAIAMYNYIDFEKITPQAIPTALFIENMSKLSEVLSSNGTFTTEQMEFLNEMNTLFSSLKVKCKTGKLTNKLRFIQGWRITIPSMLNLSKLLQTKKSESGFSMSCFDLSCLRNFFQQIKLSGDNRRPTAVQFNKAFKKLWHKYHFDKDKSIHCVEDVSDLVLAVTPELVEHSKAFQVKVDKKLKPILNTHANDFKHLVKKNHKNYINVGNYALLKCFSTHYCLTCLGFFEREYRKCIASKGGTSEDSSISNSKSYLNDLMFLEKRFELYFMKMCNHDRVCREIINKLSLLQLTHPCSDFPHEYFMTVYVRVRTYFTLRNAREELVAQIRDKQCPRLIYKPI